MQLDSTRAVQSRYQKHASTNSIFSTTHKATTVSEADFI